MIKKIYIAGPLFNAHERGFLEEIAHELEANGYDCFLPGLARLLLLRKNPKER